MSIRRYSTQQQLVATNVTARLPDPLQTYSAPTGSAADGVSYVDSSYDGSISNSMATGGLGRLSDGVVGEDTEDLHPHRYVGWRRYGREGA